MVAVNVADGECEIDPGTFSRNNYANFEVGIDLIERLLDAGVLKDHNVKIVTQYTHERQDWVRELVQFSLEKEVPTDDLPEDYKSMGLGHRTIFASL